MGKYGLKIASYEAAVLYEYNLGVRDYIQKVDAMLTKSLFFDYLESIGMESVDDKYTRDVVVIRFNFGTSSYQDQMKKIAKQENYAKSIEDEKLKLEKLNKIEAIKKRTDERISLFEKHSIQDLREILYNNGIDITYVSKNKNGDKKSEKIHYKMAYRTAGKAKIGECCFICDRLYDKAIDFLHMGIDLPSQNAQIVELQAYSSLITSTIVGKIKINPNEILILDDVDRFFITDVISIETDEEKHCYAEKITNYKLKNTLFDGQALIDESIFPSWGDGYVLLRQHMFKAAAFNTKIQLFFKDKFGNDYENATIKDKFGRDILVKNIKLITTDNAIKWTKFKVSIDYWFKWVELNGSYFGVVKTAHESKLGTVQQQSYQMINALDINTISGVVEYSVNYINDLKNNDAVFLNYLQKNSNFSNDFDVLLALVENDPYFIRSEYFIERRKAIIKSYIMRFKNGKVLNNGDNLVIVGSPYAMLLHSVGENVDYDPTFSVEDECIQCYTERFDNDEYLAEFRSPFNSRNNLGYLHNKLHPLIKKYFNFGRQIIAINMIGTSFQDRNNGSDQDSDSIYVTNQTDIVEHAKYCVKNYQTIVNNIPKESSHYSNSMDDYAVVDTKIAAGNMAIGESSNLAQLCQTYSYSFLEDKEKYDNYACILAVLAQAAIDSAKRRFDIDINEEIKRIKTNMNVDINGYPAFWFILQRKNKFSKSETRKQERSQSKVYENPKCNKDLVCPMNYLFDLKFDRMKSVEIIPNSEFFVKYPLELSRRKSRNVEKLIEKYSYELFDYNTDQEDNISFEVLEHDFDELIDDIRNTYISNKYLGLMSYLIDRALQITPQMKSNSSNLASNLNKNRSLLFKVLYKINPECFLMCFKGRK